jgi:hypothetical protein
MRMILIYFFLLFESALFPYEYDKALSNKLHKDYKNLIIKTSIGRELYLEKFKYIEKPLILLRYMDNIGYAWYDPQKNTIIFNTKYIMVFFDINGYDDKKIIDVFYFSDKTRKEFVKYSDTIFLHEMIHSYQKKIYPSLIDYRNNFFIELEYEAYFLSDIYFFEKMKNNKKLFLKILSNNYIDLYTADAMSGFFSMITDLEEYKKIIKKRYQNEISGYVSLSDEEVKRKAKIEEKKLISYVVGNKEIVIREKEKLDEIEKIKEAYQKSISDLFENKYYLINCDALSYTLENSYQIKNYYLLFKSASYFIKNKCNDSNKKINNILDESEKNFMLWISKNKEKILFEDLYLTIKEYDKYLDFLKKDFSKDILEIRDNIYVKKAIEIKRKLDFEKDELKREEYSFELDFLYRKLGRKAIESVLLNSR